jgi:nicotinate phosphoribosyltransferase
MSARGADPGALLTDLYQLTMLQAYFDRSMNDTAVFELFVRRLPKNRNFLVAAGLEQALEYLCALRFTERDIEDARRTELFRDEFLAWLARLEFTGEVDALPEGTVFFADEPVLRVTAPLAEAQLVESRLVNIVHFQTLIASKAARCVLAAPGKTLVDFGMRRAHGADAALHAARASYLAGFTGTSNVSAQAEFGIPAFGTMAHSFIQAHASEPEAFAHFVESQRGPIVLLIDTYDTIKGAERVVELARRLRGRTIDSVRLDSGDFAALSREVRRIFDAAGLRDIGIFASGGLDELSVHTLVAGGAPIDGFGIGTSLDVSEDCPALDCVYKLQAYAGKARRKRSTGKATWPGRKQVFRRYAEGGRFDRDVLTLEGDPQRGEPLLEPVMKARARLAAPTLAAARAHAAAQLAKLPDPLRSLERSASYTVEVADALAALAARVDEEFK